MVSQGDWKKINSVAPYIFVCGSSFLPSLNWARRQHSRPTACFFGVGEWFRKIYRPSCLSILKQLAVAAVSFDIKIMMRKKSSNNIKLPPSQTSISVPEGKYSSARDPTIFLLLYPASGRRISKGKKCFRESGSSLCHKLTCTAPVSAMH